VEAIVSGRVAEDTPFPAVYGRLHSGGESSQTEGARPARSSFGREAQERSAHRQHGFIG
jgi:hypothetical protein